MKILIGNDDGIKSEGMKILAEAASRVADVYISVPKGNCSGTSRQITFSKPVRVAKNDFPNAISALAVEGTPTDALKLGLQIFEDVKFDLVLSGINHGANIGHDVFYSGTFAVALEAYSMGYNSLSLSQCVSSMLEKFYTDSKEKDKLCLWIADFIKKNVENVERFCLNVNFPKIPVSQYSGIQYTLLSGYHHGDTFVETEDAENLAKNEKSYVFQRGNWTPEKKKYQFESADLLKYDYQALGRGFVSVTPVNDDLFEQEHKQIL